MLPKITIQPESRSLSFLKWMQSTVQSQYYSHTESMDKALHIVEDGRTYNDSMITPRIKN